MGAKSCIRHHGKKLIIYLFFGSLFISLDVFYRNHNSHELKFSFKLTLSDYSIAPNKILNEGNSKIFTVR